MCHAKLGRAGSPSLLARSRRSSHTVQVLRKLARHVIVDDGLNTLDVQTTGGQIGSHEIVHVPVSELLESSEPLIALHESLYGTMRWAHVPVPE